MLKVINEKSALAVLHLFHLFLNAAPYVIQ